MSQKPRVSKTRLAEMLYAAQLKPQDIDVWPDSDVEELCLDLIDARAELAAMRPVVEAAKQWREHHGDNALWVEHGDVYLAQSIDAYEKGEKP